MTPRSYAAVFPCLALLLSWTVASAGDAPACHVGAYRDDAGHLLSLQAMEEGTLRFFLLDGRSGQLRRSSGDTYTAGAGWRAAEPVVATARLGRCGATSIEFSLKDGPAGRWTRVPLKVRDTKFSSGDISLVGRLVEPPGRKPAPTVVFVHGSGQTAVIDSIPWQFLLPAEGISVFVFDKRGTGGSTGEFTQDFVILADDVAAAVRETRRLAAGRIARLGLAGFSQGGWIAPLAATKAPVDFVVVGFGVVGSPVEQDVWQVSYELQQQGFGADALAKAGLITQAAGEFVTSGYRDGLERLDALKSQFAGEPWLPKIQGQYSGLLLAGEIERAQAESPGVIWNYDAMSVLRSLDIPQLWIMAAADSIAPSAPTIERLRQLQQERKPIDIAIFPDTDHGIYNFETGADGSRHITRAADGYFPLQRDWIENRVSPPYGRAQWLPAPAH